MWHPVRIVPLAPRPVAPSGSAGYYPFSRRTGGKAETVSRLVRAVLSRSSPAIARDRPFRPTARFQQPFRKVAPLTQLGYRKIVAPTRVSRASSSVRLMSANFSYPKTAAMVVYFNPASSPTNYTPYVVPVRASRDYCKIIAYSCGATRV